MSSFRQSRQGIVWGAAQRKACAHCSGKLVWALDFATCGMAGGGFTFVSVRLTAKAFTS